MESVTVKTVRLAGGPPQVLADSQEPRELADSIKLREIASLSPISPIAITKPCAIIKALFRKTAEGCPPTSPFSAVGARPEERPAARSG
jgi:hypothetical protein